MTKDELYLFEKYEYKIFKSDMLFGLKIFALLFKTVVLFYLLK